MPMLLKKLARQTTRGHSENCSISVRRLLTTWIRWSCTSKLFPVPMRIGPKRPRHSFHSPNYSLRDIYCLIKGFAQVPTFRVYHEMLSVDLSSLGPGLPAQPCNTT